MTHYDSSRNQIVTLGGHVMSVPQAKALRDELTTALNQAEEFNQRDDLQDIRWRNEMILNNVLSPTESDHLLELEIGHEESATLAEQYFVKVTNEPSSPGHHWVDVLMKACDIPDFISESTGIIAVGADIPKGEC